MMQDIYAIKQKKQKTSILTSNRQPLYAAVCCSFVNVSYGELYY